jgi:hypothetical protein
MAIKKAAKFAPTIFTGSEEPNDANVEPGKVGDLYIRVHSGAGSAGIYFCKTIHGSGKWGTAGTG